MQQSTVDVAGAWLGAARSSVIAAHFETRPGLAPSSPRAKPTWRLECERASVHLTLRISERDRRSRSPARRTRVSAAHRVTSPPMPRRTLQNSRASRREGLMPCQSLVTLAPSLWPPDNADSRMTRARMWGMVTARLDAAPSARQAGSRRATVDLALTQQGRRRKRIGIAVDLGSPRLGRLPRSCGGHGVASRDRRSGAPSAWRWRSTMA